MAKAMTTQEKLLLNARRLFWAHGYSNVTVRQIAAAAGVDVALISRYFGGKLSLFEATLDGAFRFDELASTDADGLIEAFLKLFNEAPRDAEEPSTLRLLLTNAHDEDVGTLVRASFQTDFYRRLERIVGSEERAALFIAVLLGISVAEKSLHLPGIGPAKSRTYEAQLRHMMRAGLDFPQDDPA